MSCTAAFNQVAFRGRADDAGETDSTWLANQNVDWTQDVDEIFRVRFEVQETAGCAAGNLNNAQLQYNLGGAGWVSVTGTSNVVQSVASPNLADGSTTTDQLTVGTGTFDGDGCFDEVNGIAGNNNLDLSASGHFEPEYCIQILSGDVTNGQTIQLRVTRAGNAFAAYDATPTITVNEAAPVVVTPTTLALVTASFAPVIKLQITPTTLALVTASFAPVIVHGTIVTPTTLALVTAGFAPTVTATAHQLVTPSTLAQSLSTFAPTVSAPRLVTPTTLALTISAFAPSIVLGTIVTPSLLELTTASFAPSIVLGTVVTPSTLAHTLSTFAPTVSAPRLVTPSTLSLSVSAFSPVVSTPRLVTPSTLALTISTFAPDVTAGSGSDITVTPDTLALILSAFAPTVQTPRLITPDVLSLTISAFAPTVLAPRLVTPTVLELAVNAFIPTVSVPRLTTPTTLALSLSAFVPTVDVTTGPVTVTPGVAELVLHRFSPNAYERVINPAVDGIVIIPPKNMIGWAGGRGGTKLPLTSSKPAVEILGHYNLAKKSNEIARQQKQAKQAKTIVEILTIISDGDLW